MQERFGRVCRMVSGGFGGVAIAALQKGAGTEYYETVLADVTASGIDPSYTILMHGEGDGNTSSPSDSADQAAMNTLHSSIAADTGKSLSQLPLVCASLGTVVDGGGFSAPITSWQTIQDAQATVNSAYPNIYYSHSNVDAVLIDGIHWDEA